MRRDHLFISYAGEDKALARWLALRLTSEGYKAWIDCFKLLGGESYPRDIDAAIKDRTFRLLGLLSHASLTKPNPLKERTHALALARKRNEEFLIPLNVDGLDPSELDWMTSDLTFIPFWQNWQEGYKQLLKKLRLIQTPCEVNDGGRIAASVFLGREVLRDVPETLFSNVVPAMELPRTIYRFRFSRPITANDQAELAPAWAYYLLEPRDPVNATYAFAFDRPPVVLPPDLVLTLDGESGWQSEDLCWGLHPWQIAKPLIRKSLMIRGLQLGLVLTEDAKFMYFPQGLLPGDEVRFVGYRGRRTSVQVGGVRDFRGTEFAYRLGFTFDVIRVHQTVAAKFRVRLRITDTLGNPLVKVEAVPRRKSITRVWHNHEVASRLLAVISFLAKGGPLINCGSDQQIQFASQPFQIQVPVSIAEEAVPAGRQPFRRRRPAPPEPAP